MRRNAQGKTRPARSAREPLAALVDDHRPLLTAAALSAGLAHARARSAPGRLAGEARAFLDLLVAALEGGGVAAGLRDNVATGALASASDAEIDAVFAVWRRAVHPLVASIAGRRATRRADEALAALQRGATAAAARWADRRIDVVAVAASAGGLTALVSLLGSIPTEAATTWLIVLHVSPRAPNLVASVLARHIPISVSAAVDGGALHLGSAHVAPPGWHLVVAGGALRLLDAPPVRFVKPSADVLFGSAAAAFGRRLASVVLSGTGSDGAAGSCGSTAAPPSPRTPGRRSSAGCPPRRSRPATCSTCCR
jgi:CheB methylesterase